MPAKKKTGSTGKKKTTAPAAPAAQTDKKATASQKGVVSRNDLVVSVAKHIGQSPSLVLAVLNSLLASIRITVKAGTTVRISGFGVFRLSKIKARRGMVFVKGQVAEGEARRQVVRNLPAVKVARFKASSEFLA